MGLTLELINRLAGKVVQLKSGGHTMTAGHPYQSESNAGSAGTIKVQCLWFDSSNQLHEAYIDVDALEVVETPKA